MILVDTSVWIDHLRSNNPHLRDLLLDGFVATHPFIIGELACGNMSNRSEVLELMSQLPETSMLMEDEFMTFLAKHRLWGLGLGFVDIHLLASSRMDGLPIWTKDKRLSAVADKLGVEYIR